MPFLSPVFKKSRNSSDTLTYWLTPSLTSIVEPVVQLRSMGSMRGASVTEGCVVPTDAI